MNAINPERPEFTAAIRGYDRPQVDEYIDRMHQLVTEAEDRARASESELEFSRHSTIGPRVTEIFELAIAEAKDVQTRSTSDCEQQRHDARADAERMVSKANDEAVATRERTERERDEALAKLEDERRNAEREVKRLAEAKQTMLAELRRLQEALAAAAGFGGDQVAEPRAEADTEEVRAPSRTAAQRRRANAA